MRLVHCILQDDVRPAFENRNNILQRPELDARNAPDHPLTWTQLVANKFNDPRFLEAVTEVFPELHSDFAIPISINRSDCPNDITPEQVDFWVTDRKSKLLAVKRRHELSGNGEGTRRCGDTSDDEGNNGDEEDDDDSLEFLPNNRAAFLQNERSTILYKWEMFKNYGILDTALCILPAELGVSTSNASPADAIDLTASDTMSARRKRRKQQQDDSSFMSPLSVAMQEAHTERTAAIDKMSSVLLSMFNHRQQDTVASARSALASASEAVADAEKTLLLMTEKLEEASNPVVKAAYEARIEKAQQRLISAEERFTEAEQVYKKNTGTGTEEE